METVNKTDRPDSSRGLNVIKPENAEVPAHKKAASFWKLQYSLMKRFDVFVIIIATIGSICMGLTMPLFSIMFGGTINTFGASSTTNPETFIEDISQLCLKFLYIGLGMWAAGYLMIWLWGYNGRIISKRIKKNYFRLLMEQEQGYFDTKDTFQFATKIQAQVKSIEMGLGDKIGNTLMAISLTIASFIIGFTYSWKLSLVLVSVLPLIIVGANLLVMALRTSSVKNRQAYEKAGGIAEEIIYHIKTVASFANFEYEIKRFDEKLQESLKAGIGGGFKSALTMGFLYFLVFASYTLAVWFGSRLIYEKEFNSNTGKPFAAGDVLTVLFTIVFGAFSLGQAAPNMKAISEAMNAAYEFFELLQRVPQIKNGTEKPSKESLHGKITFDNVSFAYPAKMDKLVIDKLNLNMDPNKVTAIVGPSGSGKSTVVNLIERLYEVTSGVINMDNIDLSKFDITYLRSLIGYVPQEPVLFNTSIRDNIIFGRENITDEQVWEACKKAYADEFILDMDEKLDYIVGIKGSKLSGGQKQRIAIARAILTQPKILILDEATSALDNRSEKEVQKALNKVSKGVTTIVIAHRLSTIMHADKIVVLKDGQILEVGTHKSLLAENGIYAGLVRSQVGTTDYNEELIDEIEAEKGLIIGEEKAINNIEKEQTIPTEEKNMIDINIIPKSKIIRKNSLEELEEKIQADKQRKAEFEKFADSKKKKLWPILAEFKCIIFLAGLAAAGIGAVWPCYGILLADSIDSLSKQNPEDVKKEGFLLAMYFLALAGGAGISAFSQNYLFTAIGEHLTRNLRKSTFIKYLSLQMGFFDVPNHTPGTLTTQLSSDTTKLNGIALSMVGISIQTLATMIIAVTLGFIFDWRLALINLGCMPLMIGASVFQFKLQQGFAAVDEVIETSAGGIVSESVCNTKTIYSYNMQKKVVRMYTRILKNGMKTINKTSVVNGVAFGFSQFCMFIIYSIIFYAGGSFMYQGTLTIKNMFRAIFSILFAGFGLGQAQQYVGDMSAARSAIVNIFNILDEPSTIDAIEISKQNTSKKPESFKGKIEFKNVTFAYPSRPDVIVFEDLSFIIEPGQNVAFVGYSGSGKSTIIQLIERFYDPIKGQILIDDIDIRELDLINLRHQMSLVAQEPVLFKTDIIQNIRYGKLNATMDNVQQAAEQARISKYIAPEYDKTIIPVSGGEKQRVALARAIIKNPRILLLDEATSALDSKVEKEIQETLDEMMKGRTTITIAHKLSTIERSDLIYVMDHGKIVEIGNHNELYDQKGKYFHLYNAGQAELKKSDNHDNVQA